MNKCKIVLDTNVLVSALGWEGIPGSIFEACVKGSFTLLLSPAIFDELKTILARHKFDFIPDEEKAIFLSLLTEIAEVTSPQARLDVIPSDPTDNRILECALSANADYIVSGDKHLLSLKNFNGIKIVSPSSFLPRLSR